MPKEPGDRVGRYIIDRRLGAGGMAEAYLAHQDGLAGFTKQIVIKVLHAHHAADPATVELFLREARVGGRLNHTNIIQIFDLGQEQGEHFIAMEHVNGLTLLQATRRCWAMGQGIPIEVACRIIASAAEGLHHAHTLKNQDGSEGGIVHRDISPDNIMIAGDGTVKVLDFGVARIGGKEATSSGDLKGKIPFMPPEQLEGGKDVDARADLFALGVTLYWCLTARRPFIGGNDALVMRAIMEEEPPLLREFNAAVSQELQSVVLNLLQKDREKRIGSAHKLAVKLAKLLPPTQENPVAKFIERMGLFDDDPPEKRPEAKNTGGWPAVVLPPESTETGSDVLAETSSSQFDLLPPPSTGSGSMPRKVSGVWMADPVIPAVEEHEQQGQDTTLLQQETTQLADVTQLADATLDEDARLPSLLADADGLSGGMALDDISPSTVRLPAGARATAPTQRTLLLAGAATMVLVVLVAIGVAVSGEHQEKAPVAPVVAAALMDEQAEALVEAAPDDEPGRASKRTTKKAESVRTIFVVGPQHVRWLSTKGASLGEGTRSIQLPESEKSLVAYDTKREGRTTVNVASHIDFNALPRGKLLVKAKPYATDVLLGNERLGPTPLHAIDVVAGTYKLTIQNNRNTVTRSAKVKAGVENVLTVDVPTK